MKKQAIPYIRFSSFKQSEGSSYERQKESIDRWLAAHPEYVRSNLVFEDLGRSGFATGEKTKYKQASGMLKIGAAIEAGLIRSGDCILLEAFDRATRRQTVDAWDLITPILKAGVAICTLDDGITYTKESLNGSHVFLLVAKIQTAHGYSKLLSERVSASYDARRKDAAAGKQVKRNVPLWLKTDGTLKPEIAGAVQEAFNLYIQGLGVHSIAVELRKKNIEGLEKLSGPTVSAWLRNKAAIGVWANTDAAKEKNREEIPDAYPAIVEKERFFLVQKLREERKTSKPTKTGRGNFLSGLARCSHCDSTMIVHNVDGLPKSFRCLDHHKHKDLGCSNNKSIPYNLILFIYLTTAYKGLQKALEKQTLSNSDKRKIMLNEKLSVVTKNISRLIELDMLDLAETKEKLLLLKEEREALQAELEKIDAGDVVESEIKRVLLEEKNLLNENPSILNAMLKDAGFNITCSSDGVMVCSEEPRILYKYLGVKRKPKSNTTDYYRLLLRHESGREWVYKIAPMHLADITTPILETGESINTPIMGRLRNIQMGVEGEEQYYEQGLEARKNHLATYTRKINKALKKVVESIEPSQE